MNLTLGDICGILINVTLMGVFLIVFFFTYVKDVEKKLVENQMKYLINDLFNDLKIALPGNNYMQNISKNIQTAPSKKTQEDINVDNSNKKIFESTISLLVKIVAIVTIAIAGLFWWKSGTSESFNPLCLLLKGLIILCFIGLTEFVFLNLVAKNYKSLDPNYVKYMILDELSKTQVPNAPHATMNESNRQNSIDIAKSFALPPSDISQNFTF
jgi:hypothetical protein